jgi:hypothetical protein
MKEHMLNGERGNAADNKKGEKLIIFPTVRRVVLLPTWKVASVLSLRARTRFAAWFDGWMAVKT